MPQNVPDYDDSHLPPVGEGTAEELRLAVGQPAKMAPTTRQMRRWSTITERESRALELTAAGATYEQIGKVLSITRKNAQLLVDRAVGRRALEINAREAPETRAILMERLLALHRRWWPMALGNPAQGIDPSLPAAEMILKIHDRISRITGLDEGDMPARVDITVSVADRDRRQDAILASLAEVAARQRAIEGEFREDAA